MGSMEFGSTVDTVVPAVRLSELSLLEPTDEELAQIESGTEYDPGVAMAGLKYRIGLQIAMPGVGSFEETIDVSPTLNQRTYIKEIDDASREATARNQVMAIVIETDTSTAREISVPRNSTKENWQDDANCLGVDPDLFFPERGGDLSEAREVCRDCVVRQNCLDFALQSGEKFGIWGGTSERERRRMRRARAQSAKSTVGA